MTLEQLPLFFSLKRNKQPHTVLERRCQVRFKGTWVYRGDEAEFDGYSNVVSVIRTKPTTNDMWPLRAIHTAFPDISQFVLMVTAARIDALRDLIQDSGASGWKLKKILRIELIEEIPLPDGVKPKPAIQLTPEQWQEVRNSNHPCQTQREIIQEIKKGFRHGLRTE